MGMLDPGESMDMKALGDLMKDYEMSEAGRTLMPGLPVVARLDGRNFSTLTRGLDKPFDARFVEAMDEVAKDLMVEFQPAVAYVQSDEITMAWRPVDPESGEEMIFGGRVQKLVSLLAGRASSKFSLEMVSRLPEKARSGAVPSMDCRVWQFPSPRLAAACFVWREADASKNSVSMLASSHFGHKQLEGASSKLRKEMLLEKGVDWSALEPRVKRGSFFFRRSVEMEIDAATMARIPEAKRPASGRVLRSMVAREDLPPLASLFNLSEALFEGAAPVTIAQAILSGAMPPPASRPDGASAEGGQARTKAKPRR